MKATKECITDNCSECGVEKCVDDFHPDPGYTSYGEYYNALPLCDDCYSIDPSKPHTITAKRIVST